MGTCGLSTTSFVFSETPGNGNKLEIDSSWIDFHGNLNLLCTVFSNSSNTKTPTWPIFEPRKNLTVPEHSDWIVQKVLWKYAFIYLYKCKISWFVLCHHCSSFRLTKKVKTKAATSNISASTATPHDQLKLVAAKTTLPPNNLTNFLSLAA